MKEVRTGSSGPQDEMGLLPGTSSKRVGALLARKKWEDKPLSDQRPNAIETEMMRCCETTQKIVEVKGSFEVDSTIRAAAPRMQSRRGGAPPRTRKGGRNLVPQGRAREGHPRR